MGQGIATSYAQLAVDVFGVPIEQDPHRAGRHRPRQRLRQRRLALALHRRLGGAGRLASERSRRPRTLAARGARGRGEPTSSTATASSRSSAPIVSIGLFELAAQAAGRRPSTSTRPAPSAGPTWPNGCHICEVEIDPRHRRRRGRRLRVGQRHRPRRQPDDRRAASSRAARCRASARRCASRSSTTPKRASSLTGSFMDYAMPRADIVGPIAHRARQVDRRA